MTTTLYFGDLRTGKVTDSLAVTGASWTQAINRAGQVDQIAVPGAEVAAKDLRTQCQAARSFVVADVDGVLQEGGPLWSRTWDDATEVLTLGAAGLWSLWDHRMVIPVLAAGQKVQAASTVVANTSLGGIARALVAQAMTHTGGAVPLVLPAAEAGTRTETFYGWQLPNLGDQLRQLTQRQAYAPDIRFRPRWKDGVAGLFVEWVMEVGTDARPLLTQVGDDWYLDASVPDSPVQRISTDEDATAMGSRGWVTGNGMEVDLLIGTAYDPSLIARGWPLLELEESRSTVTDQDTVNSYADALVARSSRPVEVWSVTVTGAAGRDILAGDYCRVTPRPTSPWLGKRGQAFMRVLKKSGSLADPVTLSMYDVAGAVS
jgi:hypothetical protein